MDFQKKALFAEKRRYLDYLGEERGISLVKTYFLGKSGKTGRQERAQYIAKRKRKE